MVAVINFKRKYNLNFGEYLSSLKPKRKHDFQLLLETANCSIVIRMLGFCHPSAAGFGHSDEDEEEAAHRPDGSHRQHHSHPHA